MERRITPVNKNVRIDKIMAHKDNYNIHPEAQIEQLGASYNDLGQFRSVVLWEQSDGSYVQLAGHGVVEAMKREGATDVRADILPPSLDPMTAKRIMLADNLHAQNSTPDMTALTSLLQEQKDEGYNLQSLGSSAEALSAILAQLGDEYEDTMPEPGDAEQTNVAVSWGVVVTCESEDEQVELLDRFAEEGLKCQALIL